jgi:hypothetical protein
MIQPAGRSIIVIEASKSNRWSVDSLYCNSQVPLELFLILPHDEYLESAIRLKAPSSKERDHGCALLALAINWYHSRLVLPHGFKLHRRICFSITMSLYLHPALMCPNAVGQPRAGKVVVLVLTGHLDLAPSTQLQFDSMWKQA